MELNWIYDLEEEMSIKAFLNKQRLPKSFIKDVKYSGEILLNHLRVDVRFSIRKGDHLRLVAPDEEGHETVPASHQALDIVYEDPDLLVVNKPAGLVSIPSAKVPDSSMANRVKGYYQRQNYSDQVIHIVTRLDRDTTGLMLIAKHRLAHALMDRQMHQGQVYKYYQALSASNRWAKHGIIEAPIARDEHSIITRCVCEQGKWSKTEYWCIQAFDQGAHLRLRLHTGRTHQIRVHLAHKGGALVGDDLYGGPDSHWIHRQALHCGELRFRQPLTGQPLVITQALPQDMQDWINNQSLN